MEYPQLFIAQMGYKWVISGFYMGCKWVIQLYMVIYMVIYMGLWNILKWVINHFGYWCGLWDRWFFRAVFQACHVFKGCQGRRLTQHLQAGEVRHLGQVLDLSDMDEWTHGITWYNNHLILGIFNGILMGFLWA